jgi:hypothetical protein
VYAYIAGIAGHAGRDRRHGEPRALSLFLPEIKSGCITAQSDDRRLPDICAEAKKFAVDPRLWRSARHARTAQVRLRLSPGRTCSAVRTRTGRDHFGHAIPALGRLRQVQPDAQLSRCSTAGRDAQVDDRSEPRSRGPARVLRFSRCATSASTASLFPVCPQEWRGRRGSAHAPPSSDIPRRAVCIPAE